MQAQFFDGKPAETPYEIYNAIASARPNYLAASHIADEFRGLAATLGVLSFETVVANERIQILHEPAFIEGSVQRKFSTSIKSLPS